MMIMKMLMLIQCNGHFCRYDAGYMSRSHFVTIKKVQTQSGFITYESSRVRGLDHGAI